MIICIVGGPGTGKSHLGTLLALEHGAVLLRTDDLIAEVEHMPKHEQWSAASLIAAQRIVATPGHLIVEGVRVAHALRKALDLAAAAPCDRLIVLRGRREEAGPPGDGHASMGKSIETVLAGIRNRLVARGVVIEERGEVPPAIVEAAAHGDLLSAARRAWKVLA